MKRLLLKYVKSYLLNLIFSEDFQKELNKRVDLPGLDEEAEARLIKAIADAIKTII